MSSKIYHTICNWRRLLLKITHVKVTSEKNTRSIGFVLKGFHFFNILKNVVAYNLVHIEKNHLVNHKQKAKVVYSIWAQP